MEEHFTRQMTPLGDRGLLATPVTPPPDKCARGTE